MVGGVRQRVLADTVSPRPLHIRQTRVSPSLWSPLSLSPLLSALFRSEMERVSTSCDRGFIWLEEALAALKVCQGSVMVWKGLVGWSLTCGAFAYAIARSYLLLTVLPPSPLLGRVEVGQGWCWRWNSLVEDRKLSSTFWRVWERH